MSKRLRDPVHGLIVFDIVENVIDRLAWQLIDTPEFQRLRRIRQLGVSEFTFPGAVHTRFSHSIGVFHIARMLSDVLVRELGRMNQNPETPKLEVARIAALLHDLGHGPFSHTFEAVQESRGVKRRHEAWSSDIILNPGGRIQPLLENFRPGFSGEVAQLVSSEDPKDIYHAIVSSSFDADRLDYLRRDRLMTGTGAGAIDFDWLMDNVRVAEIETDAPDEGHGGERRVPTFCLAAKALQAAEQFLLARYTLHQQVYFHKATRCAEHLVGRLLRSVAEHANSEDFGKLTGLPPDHPIIAFFGDGGDTVANYLALDDALVFGSLSSMARAEDAVIRDVASRLAERRLYKTLDLADISADDGEVRHKLKRIRKRFAAEVAAGTVMIDEEAAIGIYSEIGGEEDRMHKKLHVLRKNEPVEISRCSELIKALEPKKRFTRIYFAEEEQRNAARDL